MIVSLVSSDGQVYKIDEAVARRSGVISTVLDDIGNQHPIPLPNVPSNVLEKVLEYCEHHQGDALPISDYEWIAGRGSEMVRRQVIGDWDKCYMECEQEMLFEIIQAASYLDIKALLDLGCKTVANMMTGKSVEDIREMFHIENDFTPEEEVAMQVERSELETLYHMMGRTLEDRINSHPPALKGKMRRRIQPSLF